MPGIPHTKSPGLIPKILDHIQTADVPAKVSVEYIKSIGFTSSKDLSLIGLLKGIRFLDSSGKPTERWTAYRNKIGASKVLSEAIEVGYAPLFAAYPDPFRRDDDAIAKVVGETTKFADPDIALAVASFRRLCDRSAFPKATVATFVAPPKVKPTPPVVVEVNAPTHAKATSKPNDSIDLAESDLMKQAQKCVEHDLFLPAHVMAWAAFMEFLFEKLSADGLVALRVLKPTWAGEDIYEMAECVPERHFVETLKALGFCTKNQQAAFVSLLHKRNECAHPTSGYRPGLDETLGYISELLNRTKPLIGQSL